MKETETTRAADRLRDHASGWGHMTDAELARTADIIDELSAALADFALAADVAEPVINNIWIGGLQMSFKPQIARARAALAKLETPR
jgi:cytochrome c biogenesis factor